MKNAKITGIRKAITEYKNWLAIDYRHTANIMLDKSTGEVWTDIFLDCNEWKEYHSDDIISLSDYVRLRTDRPFTMQLLKEYTEIAIS